MLKEKVTSGNLSGAGGQLPPDLPGTGPTVHVVGAGPAANDSDITRQRSLDRRMRRQRRAERDGSSVGHGWSVRLW